MTEETAAGRLERYRNAWRSAPGVVDSAAGFPDAGRMETVWQWSDYVAQACLREPQLPAGLHAAGLLDRQRAEGEMATELAGRLEALVLDPVYSGKGLAGLIALIRAGRWGPDDDVVFIHTGGAPALFAYRQALDLSN